MKILPLVNPGPALSAQQARRYSRQIVIPQIQASGQERIRNAKVLCIGAGGLGSPALIYLAAAGVGTIGIVDFDTVDETNLHRQVLYGQSDIGKKKVDVAKSKIEERNPLVEINVYPVRINPSNVFEIMADYDIVIDATDNFATRYLINDAAVLLKKPYVWGSVNRFDGQAAVFWSTLGPCYRCLHPEPPAPGSVQSCADAGVFGVLCASVASIQVNEVIKAITGIGELQIGKLMIYEALEAEHSKINIHKNPQCVICGQNPTQLNLLENYESFCGVASVPEISVEDLKKKFAASDDFILIDVREPDEFASSRIPGSVLIPKAGFFDGTALELLPRDKEIILHCRSGVRSAHCLAIIQGAGFINSRHLGGGILAWEKQ
ncbi:MAG: adenylyltransferase/sulfurtransferase MoeZ [Actinobacteria bacterium]|nr:adenylyltransferase/sulfurtransferase MoeZ [Actinomycetota bacterium]NCX36942.1 adenylyltransferase/sulfurtransferase MoeZ [Actinomycetota bacterium]NCZ61216.1 adenylyltransferase/sulfurtransferase MoeZ [Actinomycetota bacterium]NDC16467.1 adenylyltransferase/sulfurtransferase MoeZ [Actinomycetota bacterium]NDE39218.1 adenylyltransferase/sulfurtransferase MoeZ [Actinomycetota bacterium]